MQGCLHCHVMQCLSSPMAMEVARCKEAVGLPSVYASTCYCSVAWIELHTEMSTYIATRKACAGSDRCPGDFLIAGMHGHRAKQMVRTVVSAGLPEPASHTPRTCRAPVVLQSAPHDLTTSHQRCSSHLHLFQAANRDLQELLEGAVRLVSSSEHGNPCLCKTSPTHLTE